MRRVVTVVLGVIAVGALVAVAAGRGSRHDRNLHFGFQLQAGAVSADQLPGECVPVPVPPAGGTSSGTWSAAGALADAGQATACFHLTPAGTRLRLHGALLLTSQSGTLTLAFSGFAVASGAQPPAALLQWGRARDWHVSRATGAYARLRARGVGEVVANLARGDITVLLDGHGRTG